MMATVDIGSLIRKVVVVERQVLKNRIEDVSFLVLSEFYFLFHSALLTQECRILKLQ